jgi:hypothetical protein
MRANFLRLLRQEAIQRRTAMKRTVLAAALMAALSMPAFAEDAVRTDDASTATYVDPVTTSATTPAESDMRETSAMKSDCMRRKTALHMM